MGALLPLLLGDRWVGAESRRRSAKCITCTHKRNRRRGGEAPRSLFPPTEPLIPTLAKVNPPICCTLWFGRCLSLPPCVAPGQWTNCWNLLQTRFNACWVWAHPWGAMSCIQEETVLSLPPSFTRFPRTGLPSFSPSGTAISLLPFLFLLRGGETWNFFPVEHERISVLQQSLT